MPEYLSPGVYVEEIEIGSRPIEGVSTSTAGFVGVTERGPVDGLPVLVTSFADFQRTFGGYLPESPWGDARFLAYAVQGFFDNEGQRAFIKRVPGDGALNSSLDIPDGIVVRLQADMGPNPTRARLTSLRGISVGTNVTFRESGGGSTFTDTKAVATFSDDTGEITWAGALAHSYTQAETSVTVRIPSAAPTLTIRARDPGKWGDDLSVSFEYTTPARSALVSGLSITLPATMAPALTLVTGPDPGGNPTQATLGAGEGARVHVNDMVEFREGANRERRQVTGVAGDVISWVGNVANDYTVAGSTVHLLVLSRPLTLVTGPDPTVNPKQATLSPGEGALILNNDTVEFSAGTNRESRQVTGVAGDIISWANNIENDYRAGGSVRMLTAVRAGDLWLLLPSVAGLSPGDRISITGGGLSEQVTIDAGWDGASTAVPITTATVNSYLAGAVVGLSTLAVRAGASTVRVQSSRSFYEGAIVELDNGTNREYFTVLSISGNDLNLSGPTVNNYDVGTFARLAEFRLSVHYSNAAELIDQTETFDSLSMNSTVPTKYVVTVVNARSKLVRVTERTGPAVAFDSPATLSGSLQPLTNGDDGNPPLDDAFIGQDLGPGLRTGLQAMIDIDQVSIVAIPGKTSQAIQNALIEHCESLMDRFAVLDPPQGADVQEVQDFRNRYDTKYAALYYPWITVRDPLVKDNRNIPPSGHMIGIYARVDDTRGVHKAPANEVIRGIVDLEQIINKREQDILNPSPVNINVLRDFRKNGRGLRVWGARCITSDTIWKYINVRRLFIFLEESLDEGTQYVVFEPNDEPLWDRVKQSVTNFLTRVWRDGALAGTKPEEAFFVKCDRTTMTQDDIDNGRLIMIIGVAPVKPAEFVIIRIGQLAGGSQIAES